MIDLEIIGEGPTLLLLHGMPVPPSTMDLFKEGLADRYQVVIPHLHELRTNSEETFRVLSETLSRAGIKGGAIIGHSFGMYRAVQLSVSGQFETTSLVGIGPIVHLPEELLTAYGEMADAIEADALDIFAVLLSRWVTPQFAASNPTFVDLLGDWMDEIGVDGLLHTLRVASRGEDLHPRLSDIHCPTLLYVGALDLSTPPPISERIASLMPNARVEIVEGVGHFPQYEDPARTLEAVSLFLEEGR